MVALLGETKLKKKAARVIFADRLAHAKPLMLDMNALNVYQTNIYQSLILLYKAHTGAAPLIFFNKFSKINHNYRTSAKNSRNYSICKSKMKLTNFEISRRGPILWNTDFRCSTKRNRILTTFKEKVKEILLSRDNEVSFF